MRSLWRAMSRQIAKPKVCASAAGNRSWLNGMRYSAVHPCASTFVATSQTPSQDRSSLPSFEMYTSRLTPSGLAVKRKPVRLSW